MAHSNGTTTVTSGALAGAGKVGKAKSAAAKTGKARKGGRGIEMRRHFTTAGQNPLDQVVYERRQSVITNPDGSIVFKLEGAEIPAAWSQLATDIVISKYFRKAGLHGDAKKGERSVREVVHRIANTIRTAGEDFGGYFAGKTEADTFEAELSHLLVNQVGAFNSPVWFNCGLFHQYEITGSGGNWAWDLVEGESNMTMTANAYARPQCSACFIQQVDDDLMSIYELMKSEARLFKYGSGTGSNFSSIRGKQEKLSGGGTSSGLMSFLEVFDRAAGSTKSGGTTRRAAKMVCLDMDHPEIVDFITWKSKEEKKAHALIAAGYPADFNGEAYHTISGQNSNNSVRVTDDFLHAVEAGGQWQTRMRTTGEVCETLDAKTLWRHVAEAAWSCADPGVQYDSTINRWHTCPNSGKINASNPCVTGDTRVATAEGWQRIDSLLDAPFRVVGADGELHEVQPAFPTGTKPVYQLVTATGLELKLTADHRVLTKNRGDVQACELTADDVLLLGKPGFGSRSLDPRVGEFVGLMLGDGCITRAGEQRIATLTLGAHEESLARRVHDALFAYRRDVATDGRQARETDVGTQASSSSLRINTSSAPVLEVLDTYAVLDAGSARKTLKEAVRALDRDSLAAVLRGLFTADGTVAHYGDKSQYVALDSTSLALLGEVQTLLLGFGVKAKLCKNRRVMGQTMALLPDGKGGRREYPVDQIHSLRISRSSRVVFETAIGFADGSAKREALRALNAEVSTYADRFEDSVESITFLGEEPVFDLTEPVTSHFVANGVVVHNCSEYMFLDDTACNLSSVNLTKFLKPVPGSGTGLIDANELYFDVEGFRSACRTFFVAQEILVDLSSYPTQNIAKNSHDYRPLGLGYANLGSMLMLMGVPYDSDQGRAISAAITAILCGHAYKASAEMAATKGAFNGYAKNREPMLRVMQMHREAAYGIDRDNCPKDLYKAACEDWDQAVELGKTAGYRNAQATVLAPTGTIGLLMDCDTTGVEPDFALVKFKKLAGGGYFKIVNQSVPAALKKLGYAPAEVKEIVAYVSGTNTLLGAPHVNRRTLKEKGFTSEDMAKIETALPGVFDLSSAFAPWVLGEEAYERLGVSKEQSRTKGFVLLEHLGFTRTQVAEASETIVGRMTIEGAPHLRVADYPVFDCANRCGTLGQRYLAPMSHVKMMAAVQPFLSGAISKTVNLPNESTVEEVEEIYEQGWKLGLKAVALYRDGCKASQPLSGSSDKQKSDKAEAAAVKAAASAGPVQAATRHSDSLELSPVPGTTAPQDPTQLALNLHGAPQQPGTRPPGLRVRLPRKRVGFTQEAKVGGHKIFLRTGQYEDGTLGEIFIDMHKEGAAFRSLMNCFAMSVSIGLQYGVPLATYVEQFSFTRFEPQGMVEGHPYVKLATSIVDYLFRVLGVEYLHRYDLAHVKPEEAPSSVGFLGSTHDKHEETEIMGLEATQHGQHAPLSASKEAVVRSAQMAETLEQRGQLASSPLDAQLDAMMGDAPVCDVCGHITVRNGACYKCLNCGNSMGCS